jgi:hypothetical protein
MPLGERADGHQLLKLLAMASQMLDYDKAVAELAILRGLIDFVNRQVGVYMDCLSGFEGNVVRVTRQVARVQRPVGRKIEQGQPVIVYVSMEDPSRPDVIHHRIIRSSEFVTANSEAGFNEQQVCWSIIVFLFAYWDEEIRPQIARVRGIPTDDVKIDAFGDLRVLRKSIVHAKGVLSAADYRKLKRMNKFVRSDEPISLSHDGMHSLFVIVKQGIAEIIMTYAAQFPGAPDVSDTTDIAIQNTPPLG